MTAADNPSWSRFLRVSAARGEAPALVDDEGSTDFSTLRSAAVALVTDGPLAGVGAGERVLIWSRNSSAMACAVLAVWARDAIPVPCGPQTALRHLAHAADVTDATLIVAEPANVELARRATGQRVVALEPVRPGGPAAPSSNGAAASHLEEAASILFTSGSTGRPKGVVQSHRSLHFGCHAVAVSLGMRKDDRILCGVPWSFDYGWGQLLATFFRGATQVLPASADGLAVCAAIAKHRPSILAAVPSLLANLTLGVSDIERTDVSSLRLITSTGSRIAPAVLREVLACFPNVALSLNYGLTETFRTTTLDPVLARSHPDSVGRAIPGVAIAVLGDDGRPAPTRVTGEVVHRGGGVFAGYWGDPAETARVRRADPLWRHDGVAAPPAVHTGDLGYIDSGGLLYLVGRRDRQIKSMDVRVSPEEIEAILLSSGLVREAAVVSRPHDTIGDLVVAVVSRGAGTCDPVPGLKRYAAREMSQFMQPRRYHLVEHLPKTQNGKVDYLDLRRRFGAVVEDA